MDIGTAESVTVLSLIRVKDGDYHLICATTSQEHVIKRWSIYFLIYILGVLNIIDNRGLGL